MDKIGIKIVNNQRGSVMVVVLVVGLLIFLLGSALIRHYAVSEADAIEQNFAEIRVHWAMMGELAYVLSRAKQAGINEEINISSNDNLPTIIVTDKDKTECIKEYFSDLRSAFKWNYPDEYGKDIGYEFFVNSSVKDEGEEEDGFLKIELFLEKKSTIFDALRSIDKRVSPLYIEICMGDDNEKTLLKINDACDIESSKNQNDGTSRIERVYYLPNETP